MGERWIIGFLSGLADPGGDSVKPVVPCRVNADDESRDILREERELETEQPHGPDVQEDPDNRCDHPEEEPEGKDGGKTWKRVLFVVAGLIRPVIPGPYEISEGCEEQEEDKTHRPESGAGEWI